MTKDRAGVGTLGEKQGHQAHHSLSSLPGTLKHKGQIENQVRNLIAGLWRSLRTLSNCFDPLI